MLGHRDGLAGQRRFVHLQLRDLDQPQVGGNLVAGLEQHDVARDQLLGRHLPHFAAAQHGGPRGGKLLQGRQGPVGAPGLHGADGGIEHDDHDDDDRVHHVADQAGNHGGGDQHQDHEVAELVDDQRHDAAAVGPWQLIGAVQAGPFGHLVIVQAHAGVDVVLAREVGGVAQMPVAGGAARQAGELSVAMEIQHVWYCAGASRRLLLRHQVTRRYRPI